MGRTIGSLMGMAALAVILWTLVATAMMTDYTGKDISGEYQSR